MLVARKHLTLNQLAILSRTKYEHFCSSLTINFSFIFDFVLQLTEPSSSFTFCLSVVSASTLNLKNSASKLTRVSCLFGQKNGFLFNKIARYPTYPFTCKDVRLKGRNNENFVTNFTQRRPNLPLTDCSLENTTCSHGNLSCLPSDKS